MTPGKKRLDEATFLQAISQLDVGAQTIEIARGVLVDGRPQTDFVKEFGLSKGAVSQAVRRVWSAVADDVPEGCERITVVLPVDKARIVKQWSKQSA